jgi:lipoprotein-anchoring transpeptidase ErfK/SrfK
MRPAQILAARRVPVLGSISALGLTLAALVACSDPVPPPSAEREEVKPVQTVAVEGPVEVQAPVIAPSLEPAGLAIDRVAFAMAPAEPLARQQQMIRAQVLLDRAHFSPGVIDGKAGGNMRQALRAYQQANNLPVSGDLDQATWNALVASDDRPVMTDYAITAEDAKGPYVKAIPKEYADQAKLPKLAFTSPAEMLAERFHMDEKLLRSLNPNADFAAPGTRILVVAPRNTPLPAKVARIEVDKGERVLRAYDGADKLLAVYPATVGSADLPTPAGEWAVRAVAPNPTYTYDPSRLNFGKKEQGKLTIPAGPNNPVGVVWIDLTKDTYGIHGGPDPTHIGKTDSHGCVRLTNWDVAELSKAVSKGVKVAFVGTERGASAD